MPNKNLETIKIFQNKQRMNKEFFPVMYEMGVWVEVKNTKNNYPAI